MNGIIQQMKNRGSIRKFDESKSIDLEILNNILQATFQSPSYINGQQYSVILVTNQDKKDKLYNYTISSSGKGMSFIKTAPIFVLFVMDFNKINYAMQTQDKIMKIHESIESLLVGSVDVGILVGAMTTAAESYGLGTVTVGAIRRCTKEIIADFNLPEYTFPIAGMCLGYPAENVSMQVTPRLPINSVVSYNTYSLENFKETLLSYDKMMTELYAKKGLTLTWTDLLISYYQKAIYPENGTIYQDQGFHI